MSYAPTGRWLRSSLTIDKRHVSGGTTTRNPQGPPPSPHTASNTRSAASLSRTLPGTRTERTNGILPHPNPGSAVKAQESREKLAATQKVATQRQKASSRESHQSQSTPPTKRLLSLADRPGCLHLRQAQPGGWPAWKRAWVHVLSLLWVPPSTEICQSFLNAVKNFFMGMLANYEAPIEPFNPDVDMKDAGILLKKLVDPPPETSQDSTVEFAACSFLRSHCLLLESSPFQR